MNGNLGDPCKSTGDCRRPLVCGAVTQVCMTGQGTSVLVALLNGLPPDGITIVLRREEGGIEATSDRHSFPALVVG
jgi:hypothetical protein